MTTVIHAEHGLLFTVCPGCGSHDTEIQVFFSWWKVWNGQMGCFSCNKMWQRKNDKLTQRSLWVDVTHNLFNRAWGVFLSRRKIPDVLAKTREELR